MAAIIEVRASGAPNLVESGELEAVGQTPWMALSGSGEHVFTVDVDAVSSPVGTFVIEARRAYKDGTTGPTKTIFSSTLTTDFPQTGRLAGFWEVRARCSAYTSGRYNLAVAQ